MTHNTAEGIATHLGSLDGLRALAQARRCAGYERNELLNEFVILGRWYLDACGNTMLIDEGSPAERRMSFEPVITLSRMREIMRGQRWSAVSGSPFPSGKCAFCLNGWTVPTAHDFVALLDAPMRYQHRVCFRADVAEKERATMLGIFRGAGHPCDALLAIPSMYGPTDDLAPPWFLAQVGSVVIRIGWRKRVIAIDWESTGVLLPTLFSDQQVTQNEFGVHAWGPEKAAEYLRRLMPKLLEALA